MLEVEHADFNDVDSQASNKSALSA